MEQARPELTTSLDEPAGGWRTSRQGAALLAGEAGRPGEAVRRCRV